MLVYCRCLACTELTTCRGAYEASDWGPCEKAAVQSLEDRIAFAYSSHAACREASNALACAQATWIGLAKETRPAARLAGLTH